jgi:hypothetical protein
MPLSEFGASDAFAPRFATSLAELAEVITL